MHRLVLAFTLVPLLATGACATNNEVGQGEIHLTAQSRTGQTYRLAHADLAISGPEHLVLHTDDDPTQTRLDFRVQTGDYRLVLNPGWTLERIQPDGTTLAVNATLTSPSPLGFHISDGGFTPITLSFKVGADMIDFGEGQGGISIDVDDTREPTRIVAHHPFVSFFEGEGVDVHVSLSQAPATPGLVEVLADRPGITVSPSTLQFGVGDYGTPQTVHISAPVDSDGFVNVHRITLRMANAPDERMEVTVFDHTAQSLELSQPQMFVEEGIPATNSLRLRVRPEAPVTVTLSGDSNVTVSPQQLEFTPDDYDQPKEFSVLAPFDPDHVRGFARIFLWANNVSADIWVDIADLDVDQQIVVEMLATSVVEGGMVTGTVRLVRDPHGPLSVDLMTTSAALVSDQSSLYFDSSNWNQPQPVVLSAVEDDDYVDESVGFQAFALDTSLFMISINVIDNDQRPRPPVSR